MLPGTMSSFCLDLRDPWVWEDAMTTSSCNSCCQIEEDEEEATTEQGLHRFSIFLVCETTQLIPCAQNTVMCFPERKDLAAAEHPTSLQGPCNAVAP